MSQIAFIDTHTHIYGEEFDDDRHEMIERAKSAGALHLLLPNIDEASIEPMLQLCKRYQGFCLPMMGIQPEELPEDPLPLLEKMEQILEADKETRRYVAVGEVGIDLYWDASRREEQICVFRRQIEWAVRYRLPLVIHCRAAHRDLVDTLSDYKAHLCGGIFHCFDGSEEEAKELLTFPNFCLGIGGILTFKKSTLPETLRKAVPIDRIVVETDAPYLTPVPFRGKRNEPAYVPFIIEKLAEVYEKPTESMAALLLENTRHIFPTLRN